MNRRRQAVISLSAAVISGLLVYGVYLLQLRQIELQETVEVVVPKHFLAAGTVIASSDLKLVSLPLGALRAEMITRLEEAAGLEAAAPLGGEEPILRWKVGKYRLLPRAGEATFQIPKEYVKSVSSGIRAGDEVTVYVSDAEAASRRLYPLPVVVAGVKTAANLEIDNPKNPNLLSMANDDREGMYASRRDANGSIDSINLNLTDKQWLELDSLCKDGSAKLVIAFQPSSIKGDEGS